MRIRRGLTLVETIVIIAIIGFLFLFFIPAFQHYWPQPLPRYYMHCRNNLKQLGLIYVMYCQDNKGNFSSGISGDTDRDDWIAALRPYHKNGKLLICPEANLPRPDGNNYGGLNNTYQVSIDNANTGKLSIASSYGLNCWLYNPPSDSNLFSSHQSENFWRTNDHANASEIPLIADSLWAGSYPEPNGKAGQPPANNGQWNGIDAEIQNFCIDRHSGVINMVFMDGHIEEVGLKKLWKLRWHKNFDTTGQWTQPDANWPKWMKKLKDK